MLPVRTTALVCAVLAAPLAAQRQFAQLDRPLIPADADTTFDVALADLDGDGHLDAWFANTEYDRILLGDGHGGFEDATSSSLLRISDEWDLSCSVALGDVDGDGDIDAAVGAEYYGRNRLWLNDGDGVFTEVTSTHLPNMQAAFTRMAFGDVDGDGDLDLVCGDLLRDRLLVNDGTGRFVDAGASHLPADGAPTVSVVLGDVDGDGDLDLLLGNEGGDRLFVNDGTGRFSDAGSPRPLHPGTSWGLELADVDGDADLDLIATSNGVELWLNDGTGTFTDATQTRLPSGVPAGIPIVTADVDGDGDGDVVIGDRLLINDGAGSFADETSIRLPAAPRYFYAVAFGDLDGDGDLDAVVGRGPDALLHNDGTGRFTNVTRTRTPIGDLDVRTLALGDIDGDGDADAVVVRGDRSTGLWINDGFGRYGLDNTGRLPAGMTDIGAVTLVDVDGDHDLDVALGTTFEAGGPRLLLNDGSGTFQDVTGTHMPRVPTPYTEAIAAGDLNGDGHPDLVFGCLERTGFRLFLNDGTGRFSDATPAPPPIDFHGTTDAALGDLDGDGDLDLVLTAHLSGRGLYLNDGSGSFSDRSAALPTLFYLDRVALGDVDADGDLDLVFAGERTTALLRNDGSGAFVDVSTQQLPASATSMVTRCTALELIDFDRDGDLDLFRAGWQRGSPLYTNDGTGRFSEPTPSRLGESLAPIASAAVGDVDGDGDEDILVGQPAHLLVNLLRQLHAPRELRPGEDWVLEVFARYGPQRLVDVALPAIATGVASTPLPPLGTLGLDPASMIALPPLLIPQPQGVGSLAISVPSAPALVGTTVFAQALLLRYPLDARLTNVTPDVVVR